MTFTVNASLLDAIVLSVVSTEDTYGYKITQEVNKIIGVSESTLYPVLRRLQKDHNLEVYDMEYLGRNRRYYKITNKGRILLNLYQEEWTLYKEKIDRVFNKNFEIFERDDYMEEERNENANPGKQNKQEKTAKSKMTAEETLSKFGTKINETIDNLKIPEKIESLKIGEKIDSLKIPEKLEHLKIPEKLESLGSKIEKKIEEFSDKADKKIDDVGDMADKFSDEVEKKVEDFVEKAEKQAENIGDEVDKFSEELDKKIEDFVEKAENIFNEAHNGDK